MPEDKESEVALEYEIQNKLVEISKKLNISLKKVLNANFCIVSIVIGFPYRNIDLYIRQKYKNKKGFIKYEGN